MNIEAPKLDYAALSPILILLGLSTAIAVNARREEASARPGVRAVLALGALTAIQFRSAASPFG